MPIPLLALAASAFAIGTTEFVIVGLIPTIAADHLGLAHTPWIAALVTLAALGLTAWSGRLDQRAASARPVQA